MFSIKRKGDLFPQETGVFFLFASADVKKTNRTLIQR